MANEHGGKSLSVWKRIWLFFLGSLLLIAGWLGIANPFDMHNGKTIGEISNYYPDNPYYESLSVSYSVDGFTYTEYYDPSYYGPNIIVGMYVPIYYDPRHPSDIQTFPKRRHVLLGVLSICTGSILVSTATEKKKEPITQTENNIIFF